MAWEGFRTIVPGPHPRYAESEFLSLPRLPLWSGMLPSQDCTAHSPVQQKSQPLHLQFSTTFCSRRRPLSITGGPSAEQMPCPLSSSAQSEHSKTTVFNVQVHENWLTEEGGPGNTHAAFQVSGIGLKYKFGSKPCPGPLLLSWGHLWVNGTFKEA